MLFVDYGLPRREYYHAQRSGRHVDLPLPASRTRRPVLYPGPADITAWVDFSACADGGDRRRSHGRGLHDSGAVLAVDRCGGAPARRPWTRPRSASLSALKTLVLPGEMGERFKVLRLRKGGDGDGLPGRDFRDRL